MAVVITHAKVTTIPDDLTDDPEVVSPVDWNDDHTVTGLGTAAEANTGDFATAAQGALADTAVQPADIGTAAAEDVGYFAAAVHTHAIGDVTGLQTALDGKAAASHTHTASEITDFSTAADARVSAAIGVTVQAYAANLTEWAGINPSANGASLVSAADYAAMRTLLDLEAGTDFNAYSANLAEWSGINPSANGGSLVAAADYAAMRTLLDLEAGTDFLSPAAIAAAYQPLDASLTAHAALVTAANKAVYYTAADTPVTYDISAYGRTLANLADETALEALLDTLPNLTSIQGRTVTLADAGADAILGWDDSASAYQNLSAADVRTAIGLVIGTNVREVLTANRTYYVRTDGSDSNTGLVDSAGGAFLTKQKAIDTIYGLDCNGKIVTVDVGNGTYTGAAVATGPLPGGGTLVFVGDTSTPGNVDINVTNANAFVARDGASMIVRGFCITTTTAGVCLWGLNRGRIDFSSIEFGTCAGDHILGSLGGVVAAEGNYAVIGNVVGNHWHAYDNGLVLVQNRTVTLTGTPSFGRLACAAMCATIECAGNTYSGSGTGQRYLAWRNGAINTEGAAVTALPGNVDGSCSDGGRYT